MYKVYQLEFWLFLANISNTMSKVFPREFSRLQGHRVSHPLIISIISTTIGHHGTMCSISQPTFPWKKKHFDINHCQDYSMYSVTKSWIGRGMQKPEHQSFAYRVKNKSAQKTSKQILYDTFPLKCFLRLFTLCLRCLKTLNQNNGKSKCTKTKPGKWI